MLPAGFGSFAEQLQHEQYALPAFYAQQRDDAQGLPFDVPWLGRRLRMPLLFLAGGLGTGLTFAGRDAFVLAAFSARVAISRPASLAV